MDGDTPTHRVTVDEMDQNKLEAFLIGVRERRLRAFTVYKQQQEASKQVRDARLKNAYEKNLAMFQKEIDRLDKLLDKVEARALKLRSLELEINQ